ncbi:MAG: GNAT family N-acetyltransferase [Chloroflexi bacterium]|nr:GNAT family N-acetyltransferase [Chloroflexota bacterium]
MDKEGRRVLQEMRAMGRAGSLLWLLDRTSEEFRQSLGGFVWVEGGRVVGNVSLSRLSTLSDRWQISNVATVEEYRGRGIARQLMEHALASAAAQGGAWVLLQVRADNPTALRLYHSLGFEAMGSETQMLLPRGAPLCWAGLAQAPLPPGLSLRPIRRSEWEREYVLAKRALQPLMQWERPVRQGHYQRSCWSAALGFLGLGSDARWGLFNQAGELVGHLHARQEPWKAEARLSLLLAPGAPGGGQEALVGRGLQAAVGQRRVRLDARFPGELTGVRQALEQAGLQERRTLVHMRLDLERVRR